MLFKATPFKIVKKDKQADKTYLFRLVPAGKTKTKLNYKSGEFYQVSILGVVEDLISFAFHSIELFEFNELSKFNKLNTLIKLNKLIFILLHTKLNRTHQHYCSFLISS